MVNLRNGSKGTAESRIGSIPFATVSTKVDYTSVYSNDPLILLFVGHNLKSAATKPHSRKLRKFGGGKQQLKLDVKTQLKLVSSCLFTSIPKVPLIL